MGDLTLPELEGIEEPKRPEAPVIQDSDDEPTHVDLGEKPPSEAEDTAKKGEHPELNFKAPAKLPTRLSLHLPPIPRAKLDGYGMFAAMAGLLGLMTSPIFLDFLSESPLAHFSDPGVELHISVIPNSTLPTGVWLSGFRVPFEKDLVVHVPYGGPYKLQIQREGFQDFTSELAYQPVAKKESDDRFLQVAMLPTVFGILNVGSTSPCGVEIGDGVTSWSLKTPVRELRVPPADYVVKFVDPLCNDKQFYVPIRDGSRSYVVWDFPPTTSGSGFLPAANPNGYLPSRQPAAGVVTSNPPSQ